MPSPTIESRGAALHFPSKKSYEMEMLINACAGQSHPLKSLVCGRNHCFPYNPSSQSILRCGKYQRITDPILQAAARSPSVTHSQQLSHMNHIIFELHCSFTPYEILILSKPKRQWLLNQLEEFPSFSKWKSEIWAWFLQNHHFSQPR